MPHSTNAQYISTEKLAIYTEATTITSSPLIFVSKYYLNTVLHAIYVQLKNLMRLGDKQQ